MTPSAVSRLDAEYNPRGSLFGLYVTSVALGLFLMGLNATGPIPWALPGLIYAFLAVVALITRHQLEVVVKFPGWDTDATLLVAVLPVVMLPLVHFNALGFNTSGVLLALVAVLGAIPLTIKG